MWVPSLLVLKDAVGGTIPTGLVFSAFMLSMSLGGMLFGLLLPVFPGGAEGLCVFVYLVAAASMAVPLVCFEFWYLIVAFLVLEAMVGMFNSCGATLRSRYYPEGLQSSIMSVFRLPLNLLVVVGTMLTDGAQEVRALQFVYGVVVAMLSVAMLLQLALLALPASTAAATAGASGCGAKEKQQ
jgi:MFS transporter, MFS domain-containing protein family, molybdate-anion transporter